MPTCDGAHPTLTRSCALACLSKSTGDCRTKPHGLQFIIPNFKIKLFFNQQQSSLTGTTRPAKATILAEGPSREKLACL